MSGSGPHVKFKKNPHQSNQLSNFSWLFSSDKQDILIIRLYLFVISSLEFMALLVGFNLWIGPGFIFESST